ncbi:MAG: hypothetical protein QM662_17850 [Gordonia sp. (in: high G+C Gram-positive bacteria)]
MATTPNDDTNHPAAPYRDIPDYSREETHYGRRADVVADELFGEDWTEPGMFFTEAGSDRDVPYRVVCTGNGNLTTYNMIAEGKEYSNGRLGLSGRVVSPEVAFALIYPAAMEETQPNDAER